MSDVAYGTNIASYNNETYATVPDGYVFEGWYSDETCTQPYNFTTMPSASITVFARWRQIQYRVFLHPNVEASDRSLDWGSDEQEMNFRITYGGSIVHLLASTANIILLAGTPMPHLLILLTRMPLC